MKNTLSYTIIALAFINDPQVAVGGCQVLRVLELFRHFQAFLEILDGLRVPAQRLAGQA